MGKAPKLAGSWYNERWAEERVRGEERGRAVGRSEQVVVVVVEAEVEAEAEVGVEVAVAVVLEVGSGL